VFWATLQKGSTSVTDIVQRPMGALPSFRELASQPTFVVNESQLERNKERLIGVPFVITRVTFRPGDASPDYVSCECTVGDTEACLEAVSRGWVPNVTGIEHFPFKADERVVFNDSSTGVRRKIVEMLHTAGMIDVGDMKFDKKRINEQQEVEVYDASPFDKPWMLWESFSQVGEMNGANGEKISVPDFSTSPSGGPFAIFAYHGLRVSIMPGYDTAVYYLS
jgi:hypothetical protein